MKTVKLLIIFAVIIVATCPVGRDVAIFASDVLELTNQATVEGEILNRSENAGKSLQIQLAEGVVVELPSRETVNRVVMQPQATSQYYLKAPFLPESVETHLKLAEVCKANNLEQLGSLHYQRVLDIDPENVTARKALNYRKIDGEWTTREDEMFRLGYVKTSRGDWTTPQKLAIDTRQVQIGRERRDSDQEVQKLIALLKAGPSRETENALFALTDPAAVPPLAEALSNEPNAELRDVYVRSLSQIGTEAAFYEIAKWAMRETDETVGLTCIMIMQSSPGMSKYFVPYLTHEDNLTVNRAAYVLGQLNDRTAIPSLIAALITQHEVVIRQGDLNLSQYTGSGNNSFVGGRALQPEKSNEMLSNREVLVALRNLTGTDFGYEVPAWWDWWAGQNQATDFDARRGGYD